MHTYEYMAWTENATSVGVFPHSSLAHNTLWGLGETHGVAGTQPRNCCETKNTTVVTAATSATNNDGRGLEGGRLVFFPRHARTPRLAAVLV